MMKRIAFILLFIPSLVLSALSAQKCQKAPDDYYPAILAGKEYCPLKAVYEKFMVNPDHATQFGVFEVKRGHQYQLQLSSSRQYTRDVDTEGYANRFYRDNLLKQVHYKDMTWRRTYYDDPSKPWHYGLLTNLNGKAGFLIVKMTNFATKSDAIAEIKYQERNEYLGEEIDRPSAQKDNFDQSILKVPFKANNKYVLVQMTNPVPHLNPNSDDVNGTFFDFFALEGSHSSPLGKGKGMLQLVDVDRDKQQNGKYTFTFFDLEPDAYYTLKIDAGRTWYEFSTLAAYSSAKVSKVTFQANDYQGRPVGGSGSKEGYHEGTIKWVPFIQNDKFMKLPQNDDFRMPQDGKALEITVHSDQPVVYNEIVNGSVRLRLYKYSGY